MSNQDFRGSTAKHYTKNFELIYKKGKYLLANRIFIVLLPVSGGLGLGVASIRIIANAL